MLIRFLNRSEVLKLLVLLALIDLSLVLVHGLSSAVSLNVVIRSRLILASR